MVVENKIERIKELIELLNKASELYYQKNTQMMTDFEYDKLYDELVTLENETGMQFSNSPSVNVEPKILSELNQVEHPAPMLSLAKTKQVAELANFIGEKEGLLSWKLDGLTIVLTYENGNLVSGVTRGTGIIGEVVTENVKQFKNVPLSITFKGRLVIRGEAIIKYSDFNKMNEDLGEDDQYKNPRNLCSGSVRQLDSSITAKRNVNCIIFALIEAQDKNFKTRKEEFSWLASLGFQVVEHIKVDRQTMMESVLNFKERVKTYDIPSDGLVLTFDDIAYGKSLGMTAKYPKHSIAFKWQDETAKTTLRSIDWLVSRTGLINPVAVFDPVQLEGTIVSRASVHNVSIMRGLKLGIGDKILVYKANMIIPQIASNETESNNIKIPTKCPVCDGEAKICNSNEVDYLYCMNALCPAKITKRFSSFVSRNAMNIDGVSDAILSKFIQEGILVHYADIFHLEDHKLKIITFEGYGEKSFQNLIESVNKARNVKLANFIFSLNIPEIGLSRAKLICNFFNNDLEKIRNATFENLSGINGIGEVIAGEWVKTFKNEEFQNELNLLLKEVSFIDTESDNSEKKYQGKTFVITGNVTHFKNRDDLIEYIENNGGKVLKAISSNVQYLINNDVTSTSTKNTKAKSLGIPIISEEDFLKL